MKYLILLVSIMFAGIVSSANHKTSFYLQRLHDPDLDPHRKLQYIDSLLSHDHPQKDSLIRLKAMFEYETGNFHACVETYESNIKNVINGSISEVCKIRFYYLVSLSQKRLYPRSIQESAELLSLDKPDSLIYYNAKVYCFMNNYSRQTHIPMRENYSKLCEDILRFALEKNLSSDVVNKIKKELYSIELTDALHSGNYDIAIEKADRLLEIPLSEREKEPLYTNIGYLYMVIGQYEAAEKFFNKLLEEGKSQYNKGITLLNYTHMLNLQGKYEETMKLFDKYGQAAGDLNKDIYYSHLLGNRAEAESNTIGYEKAFKTLVENKNFEDSLYLNNDVQDSLLLFDYLAKSRETEELRAINSHRMIVIWILAIVSIIVAIAVAILVGKHKRDTIIKSELAHRLEDATKKCSAIEHEMAAHAESESGRIAMQMLQLAAVEESLDRISDTLSSKSKSDKDKIKIISDTISSTKIDGATREIFSSQFELAHSKFFKNLYAAHPDLTPGEARMCAYLIMNLSTKEIASITSKSTRSVESTRYRIGKKLNVPDGKTLLSYIREFI